MKIIKEHLPQRCEICHKNDKFDTAQNICFRCNKSEEPPILTISILFNKLKPIFALIFLITLVSCPFVFLIYPDFTVTRVMLYIIGIIFLICILAAACFTIWQGVFLLVLWLIECLLPKYDILTDDGKKISEAAFSKAGRISLVLTGFIVVYGVYCFVYVNNSNSKHISDQITLPKEEPPKILAEIKPPIKEEKQEQLIEIKENKALDTYLLVESGNKLYKEGKYEEAINTYKQTTKIDPNNFSAFSNLGLAYGKLGRYQEAIEPFKQAIKINPNDSITFVHLGFAYEKLTQYKEAIELFEQAIKIDPNNSFAFSNLGLAYGKLEQYVKEIEAEKQAIKINPNDSIAFVHLGFAYEKLKQYKEAIDAFKQAINLNPNDTYAHEQLGIAYLNMDNKNMALEEYNILKALDPDTATRLNDKIKQVLENGSVNKEESEQDTSTKWCNRGVDYFNSNNNYMAITYLELAIKLNPYYTKAHYYLGLVYLKQGHIEQAKTEYYLLYEIDPTSDFTKGLNDRINSKNK